MEHLLPARQAQEALGVGESDRDGNVGLASRYKDMLIDLASEDGIVKHSEISGMRTES